MTACQENPVGLNGSRLPLQWMYRIGASTLCQSVWSESLMWRGWRVLVHGIAWQEIKGWRPVIQHTDTHTRSRDYSVWDLFFNCSSSHTHTHLWLKVNNEGQYGDLRWNIWYQMLSKRAKFKAHDDCGVFVILVDVFREQLCSIVQFIWRFAGCC